MTATRKSYPVFDCDAHINDFVAQYQGHFTEDEKELVRDLYWHDGRDIIVNGQPGMHYPKWYIDNMGFQPGPGGIRASIIDIAGPGMNKKIIRKLNYTALTEEQLEQLAHRGSIEPLPRIRDMDLMGIDQVLIIPIALFTRFMELGNARAAAAVTRAYNNWVKEDYCDADPDRLFPAAMLPPQDLGAAAEELRRTAKLGFSVGLVRALEVQGRFPNQAGFDPLWRTFEETGVVCGMHTATALSNHSALIDRAVNQEQLNVANQALGFIYEAQTWVTNLLLSGFLERYPRLKMAIFEANATWLPMILEACDRAYHLYGSQRLPAVRELPSEQFRKRCLISFESDEEWVYRRWPYFEDIALWSSDTYHHDGADAWVAIDLMRKYEVPEAVQAKLLGGNALKFYGLEDRAKVYTTEEPASIPRPEWFPGAEDIEREYAHAGEPRAGTATR